MSPVRIRLGEPRDCAALVPLRHSLWPEGSLEEHARELSQMLSGNGPGTLPSAVLIAEEPDGAVIGFVEVGLRSYAEGCDPSHPAGYIEGWYVVPSRRRRRIGARLIEEAERWARNQGCREIASDALLENTASQSAHESLGFELVERSVHYRKPL